jgi:ATP-binding cassette, subfamily F, member 3
LLQRLIGCLAWSPEQCIEKDIPSVEVLEAALEQFEGTILTVSHDRYFLDKIATKIIAIGDDQRVRAYPGNFSYYAEKS